MVVAKEFEKSEVLYKYIGSIMFVNSNTSVALEYVSEFHESDLEVEIKTVVPIHSLERGWIGDMYYIMANPISVATGEAVHAHYEKCIKDVLLARVNGESELSNAPMFTYTFLKY